VIKIRILFLCPSTAGSSLEEENRQLEKLYYQIRPLPINERSPKVPIVNYKGDNYERTYCVGKMAGGYASKVALTVSVVALTVATADELRHSPPLWEAPHVEQQQYPPMDDAFLKFWQPSVVPHLSGHFTFRCRLPNIKTSHRPLSGPLSASAPYSQNS
jgi:hypothetical protein